MSKAQFQKLYSLQGMDVDDELDIRKLIGTIVDGKWLIFLLVGLFLISSLAYVMFAAPVYKADALLQIEEKPSSSGLAEISDLIKLEASTDTEIEVLKSRMVLGRAVDELNMDIIAQPGYLPVLGQGIVRMFGGSDSGLMVYLFPGYAWGTEIINVSRMEIPDELMGASLTLINEGENRYTLYSNGKILLSGQVGVLTEGKGISLLVTDLVSRTGVSFSLKKIPRLEVIRTLQERLLVTEKGKRSGVLMLSIEGNNKTLIRKVLDSVSKHYFLQNIQRMSAEAEKGLDFLNSQLPDVKSGLDTAEQKLRKYRLENRSVDLSLETQKLLEQVVSLDAQLNELMFKEAELQKGFTKEHPSYIALISKRSTLTAQKKKLEEKIQSLPETQQDILGYTRDMEVRQGLYIELLNKINELSIVKAGTVGNVRILDEAAVTSEPIKPREGLIVTVATILGIFVGIFIVVIRSAFHNGVRSVQDIETIGLPVYASIPFSRKQHNINRLYKGKKKSESGDGSLLLAVNANDDLAIEAIRSLRTSMHFAMQEASGNVLMITGSDQELGKSFISANLAAVYAQMGQKILLIDADMRKGYMQKLFSLSKSGGMSEYLSKQMSLEEIIKDTIVNGLHLITCGNVPPNPSELLMTPEFGELMEWSKNHYDLVIIDTPPVLSVTDASVIGRHADISMLVAWFDITPVKEIEATLRRCEQNGIKIRGCILNGVVKKSGYDEYGQYGSYNYTYGKSNF